MYLFNTPHPSAFGCHLLHKARHKGVTPEEAVLPKPSSDEGGVNREVDGGRDNASNSFFLLLKSSPISYI